VGVIPPDISAFWRLPEISSKFLATSASNGYNNRTLLNDVFSTSPDETFLLHGKSRLYLLGNWYISKELFNEHLSNVS
jgi:hypothetical protein